MDKIDIKSLNIVEDNISKLKQVFPQIFNEDKIDFEKINELLGDYKEDKVERYNFTWPGKVKSIKIAQTPSTATLRPCKEDSKNWDETENLYIEGDNLEVLKLLQKSYYEKVKLIYIDPPYNTGDDFVYKDNYRDNIQNYLKVTGQKCSEGYKKTTNTETNGRYHSDWLNMMYPRLKLSRNLMARDGIIIISLSDHESANLKKIMDEIYGEDNFIGCIQWNSTKSVTNTALISVSHTYNYVYCKDISYFKENRNEFRLPDSEEGFDNPDNDPRGPWKADPFQVGGERPNQLYDIINPKTGVVYKPNPGCSWKNEYSVFRKLLEDNRIVFGKSGDSGPQRKRFLSEALERGRVVKTWWDDVETTTNGTQQLKKIFDNVSLFSNPKPVGLLTRLIELSTAKGEGLVLDFFSGSATTAHAVIELNKNDGGNRKFIMVQIPEVLREEVKEEKIAYEYLLKHNMKTNICEIGKERIRRAGDTIKEQNKLKDGMDNLDIGFKVFKLDSSNINRWDYSYEQNLEHNLLSSIENIKTGRTEEDILYEILLKYGIDLNMPIMKHDIEGKKVFDIGFGAVIVCLDDNISLGVVEGIGKLKEELDTDTCRVVFMDNGFNSDSVKTNAVQILKRFNIEDVKSI